jgi:uncharacterized C2H2 Zn-finger protein
MSKINCFLMCLSMFVCALSFENAYAQNGQNGFNNCSTNPNNRNQSEPYNGNDVRPSNSQINLNNSQSPCGPSCKCGCREGKPCTCSPTQRSKTYSSCEPRRGDECDESESYSCDSQQAPQMISQSSTSSTCECGCEEGDSCTCEQQCPYTCHYTAIPGAGVNEDVRNAECCKKCGVWLPEDPELFRPFMADPRQLTYSAGWRFNDQVLAKNVIDVSFFDSIAFYRWCDLWHKGSQLQLELEGAVWAVFDPLHDSSPLMNADYYGGLNLSYILNRWSFRLRGYHISSHIGDEFLLNHPGFDRRNASAEYVDIFASYELTDEIRVYAGVGYIVAQDKEFKCSRFYGEWGSELRLLSVGFTSQKDQLYGCPILGMHFRYKKDFKHHLDQTYVLGWEFGKLCGLRRRLRVYLEYHDGYSVEGQFCKQPTNYFSVRTSYGF